MSIHQRDYILRMIEQIGETLASIAGLRRSGKLDEAAILVRETVDGLLGPLRGTLDGLDARSAAILLGSRKKLAAYAALLAEEGDVFEATGDALRASRQSRQRALDLYRELARTDGGADDEKTQAAIRSLEAKLSAPAAGGTAP